MPFQISTYQRELALKYASIWALSRNPNYYNFDSIGGDCTNFTSQCLYAGTQTMNHQPVSGWYYYSLNQRAASWTSVSFFNKFIITNQSLGPFGHSVNIDETDIGDFIQLATEKPYFHHSCIIVKKDHSTRLDKIYIACHSYDAYMKPLSEYQIQNMRCIKIDGVRKTK